MATWEGELFAGEQLLGAFDGELYSGRSPDHLTAVGSTLFFSAGDDPSCGIACNSGRELWKTDGTPGGTVLVKEIAPSFSSSDPRELTNVDGTLFFTANDGVAGIELWMSDRDRRGTAGVEDIDPGPLPRSGRRRAVGPEGFDECERYTLLRGGRHHHRPRALGARPEAEVGRRRASVSQEMHRSSPRPSAASIAVALLATLSVGIVWVPVRMDRPGALVRSPCLRTRASSLRVTSSRGTKRLPSPSASSTRRHWTVCRAPPTYATQPGSHFPLGPRSSITTLISPRSCSTPAPPAPASRRVTWTRTIRTMSSSPTSATPRRSKRLAKRRW